MTKTTHTIPDVEALMLEKVILLKTAETNEEKERLRKQIDKLEKHINDCNDKHINGKKYPERMKGFPDDKPMNKTEVLKLIDSVEMVDGYENWNHPEANRPDNLDGISVGKNTFEFVDKGWSTPKTMKPSNLFK